MRPLWMVLPALLPALAACAGGTGPAESTVPTVTYAYSDDEDYQATKDKAADYCDDQYDKEAVLVDAEGEGTAREVTFACE